MHDRLTPHMTTATEVAALVKILPIETGVELIEQYARTMAANAEVYATDDAFARIDGLMKDCMSRLPGKDEYAETMAKVEKEMTDAQG